MYYVYYAHPVYDIIITKDIIHNPLHASNTRA